MKKKISFLLSIAILFSLWTSIYTAIPTFANYKATQPTLQFRQDGTFKILLLSDIQDTDKPTSVILKLLNACLDADDYDLVIFLGDQIQGCEMNQNKKRTFRAINKIIKPVVNRKLPFALVFGNHEDEGGISKETQLAYYQRFPGCLTVESEELTGCGNYKLAIQDSSGNDAVLLWFFDSGKYDSAHGGIYDYVHEDQLEWFKSTNRQLTKENGKALSSFVFQHIVVPEIYDILIPTTKETPNAVRGHGQWKNNYYTLNPNHFTPDSILKVSPSPPDYNGGEFEAWKSQGNVIAAFFGHDHSNNFKGNLDGIDLVTTRALGFSWYIKSHGQGARVVTLYQDNPAAYSMKDLTYGQLMK